jgi:hypothetical protein
MNHYLVPDVRQEPEIGLARAEARIEWALNHPHISDWLKATLRSTKGLDPVIIQNDIEMLRHLITNRARAEVEIALSRASTGDAL